MSHIVIDARLYGPKHTGLGRYTKNLLVALKNLPDFSLHQYTLLVYPELLKECQRDLGKGFRYYPTSIRHYTFAEQIFLPILISSLRPDLVHFTQFDKPILYFGKSVVTVHDLIRHFSKGSATTTKSPLLYWPKYIGYRIMSWFILKFSYLIVPSNFWRNYLIDEIHINPKDIVTTYEAVDPKFLHDSLKPAKNPLNYIIYTGNLYPHKNINVILEALKKLPDISLKIICARDLFAKRIEESAAKIGVSSQIEFLGYIPDQEFTTLYSQALALVHPALLEGFSLTGLESMALGCPVISSNSSCLPEIYEKSVLYFDPHKPLQLVKQINNLRSNPTLRQKLITKGYAQLKKFSWNSTALQTLEFYHAVLKRS